MKGKVERFFRSVREQFLCRQLDLSSLDALNRQFIHWVEEGYNAQIHSVLGMTPLNRFALDRNRVRFLPPNEANDELFLINNGSWTSSGFTPNKAALVWSWANPARANPCSSRPWSTTSSFNPIGAMTATNPCPNPARAPEPRWTRQQIRAARMAPLVPLLQKRGFELIELPASNFELTTHKCLLVKDSDWRWPERKLTYNPSSAENVDLNIRQKVR